MTEERKRNVKGRRQRQRMRRVWEADEWLSRVDWGRFGPQTPKRQAWEIIRRLAKARASADETARAISWTDRVKR